MTDVQFHTEQTKIAELVAAFGGNRYVATMYLADATRTILDRYNNQLLESEAIAWLLTGVRPPHLKEHPQPRPRRNWRKAWVTDRLSEVLDVEVKQAVLETIRHSKRIHELDFCYNLVQDEPRRTRVRILSRIIWTATQQEEM